MLGPKNIKPIFNNTILIINEVCKAVKRSDAQMSDVRQLSIFSNIEYTIE